MGLEMSHALQTMGLLVDCLLQMLGAQVTAQVHMQLTTPLIVAWLLSLSALDTFSAILHLGLWPYQQCISNGV